MRRILPVLAVNVVRRRPTSMVLFVTNRCNLDCATCFYTAREPRDELNTDEFRRLAATLPRQWYLMLTGGEPFVRPDLAEIAAAFYDRGVANIHISTNATLHDRTVAGVRDIATRCARSRIIVVISIDGPPEVHDRIRGARGLFDRTAAVTRDLIALKRDLANLAIVANFTLCAHNQRRWRETFDYLHHDLRVDTINVGLIRGRPKDAATKAVDLTEYRNARKYLADSGNARRYFPPLLRRVAALKEKLQTDTICDIAAGTPPARYRCLAGTVFGVVTETGDVYPCEMLGRRLGNLRDTDMDFERIWSGGAACAARADIARGECLCTYECAMGATMAASVWTVGALARGARSGWSRSDDG